MIEAVIIFGTSVTARHVRHVSASHMYIISARRSRSFKVLIATKKERESFPLSRIRD